MLSWYKQEKMNASIKFMLGEVEEEVSAAGGYIVAASALHICSGGKFERMSWRVM